MGWKLKHEIAKDADQFLKDWLLGSTCHNKTKTIHWTSDCGNFVLLKHHSHSEWAGRASGRGTCGTYYALYDIRDEMPGVFGEPYLGKWEGRWTKAKQKELEEVINERQRNSVQD